MTDLQDYYRYGDSETDDGRESMYGPDRGSPGGDSYITEVSDSQYASDFAANERQPPPDGENPIYEESQECLPLPSGHTPRGRAAAYSSVPNSQSQAESAAGVHIRPASGLGNNAQSSCWYNICWLALLSYGLMRNIVVGILELVWQMVQSLQKAATFRVVPPDAMFSRKQGSTTATGGALVVSIFVQSWILVGLIYLVIAVGTEGVLANAVEIPYLKLSTPGLFSVPLGLYIFAWGGLQARTSTARNVMTVYGTLEICKAVGDVINVFRYVHLVHTRQHWSVLLTNEVPRWLAARMEAGEMDKLRLEFQHGDCGEPHSIILLLLVSLGITTILSFMNVSTVIWRNVSEDVEMAMAKAVASDTESGQDDEQWVSAVGGGGAHGRRRVSGREASGRAANGLRGAHIAAPGESHHALIVKMLTRDD